MASAANSLRLCLRACRLAPPAARIAARASGFLPPPPPPGTRSLSCTQTRWRREEDPDAPPARDDDSEDFHRYQNPQDVFDEALQRDDLSEEQRAEIRAMLAAWDGNAEAQRQYRMIKGKSRAVMTKLVRPVRAPRNPFWGDEEVDPELITDETGEEDFEEDDMMSMAHGKLEEYRERREYARLTVWEMPLLTKLAKPFQPTRQDQPLRFRYTTYMGEFHPAERKVVVEFCPKDLPGLDDPQRIKLIKLAGPRYNPEKDIIKISCEMFEHQAQNKRYLGDMVNKLIAEAKDMTDTFSDVPLDLRHHQVVKKPKFPREWRVTEERRQELDALRCKAFEAEQARKEQRTFVNGKAIIAGALAGPPPNPVAPKVLVAERAGFGKSSRQLR